VVAGVWQANISKLLHVSLPWPLHNGLLVKHAVLMLVACFAVEQLSGQTWRMFVTGVSGKVRLRLHYCLLLGEDGHTRTVATLVITRNWGLRDSGLGRCQRMSVAPSSWARDMQPATCSSWR
jgi:hypothetical protein